MINWMPTVAGLCAAIGLGLTQSGESSLRIPGIILSVVGTALLGIVAKQYNVHGGTKVQPTPPEIAAIVEGCPPAVYPGADTSDSKVG